MLEAELALMIKLVRSRVTPQKTVPFLEGKVLGRYSVPLLRLKSYASH